MLYQFHAVFISCCIYFILYPFDAVSISCCIDFMLYPFHSASISFCIDFMLYSFHVVSTSCCIHFMLYPFNAVFISCSIHITLYPFHVVSISCCIHVMLSPCHEDPHWQTLSHKVSPVSLWQRHWLQSIVYTVDYAVQIGLCILHGLNIQFTWYRVIYWYRVICRAGIKKSRIRETLNLSTDVDHRTRRFRGEGIYFFGVELKFLF